MFENFQLFINIESVKNFSNSLTLFIVLAEHSINNALKDFAKIYPAS